MNKTFGRVEVKSADQGLVTAVISTFNVVDKDGDVVLPGAIQDGAEVVISAYGHTSHGGALPVGKGVIRTTDSEAILEGKFFMDTTAGRDTFEVVKQLGPLGEWSYSLHNVKSHDGKLDGRQAKFLESIFIKEASPVLLGASVNTRTLSVKSAGQPQPEEATVVEYRGAIRPHDTTVATKAWRPEALPSLAAVADLRAKHAWVDTTADPEASASYKFAHHGADGAANARACLLGLARLKAGDHGIPADDVAGVWEHLAAHLQDAEIEPPALKGAPILQDQLLAALVGVVDAIDAAERVQSVRAVKGKQLSQVNSEVLVWMEDELRRLKSLLTPPDDELVREYVRFVKTTTRSAS